MSIVAKSLGASVRLKVTQLRDMPEQALQNSRQAVTSVFYAAHAEREHLGKRFASATNMTNTGDWFDLPSTPVAVAFSGKTFLEGSMLPIELRPYQIDALELFKNAPHVGCWDEMGTGKTVIAVALDAHRRQDFPKGKTLVICPGGSVQNHWQRHFERMQPHLRCLIMDPKNRARDWKRFCNENFDVFIMHWQAVQLMPELRKTNWLHIIADEALNIKNRKSKVTVALKQLPAQHKTALTGTPNDGKIDEYWSLLHWLYPKSYSSYWAFRKKYCLEKPNWAGYMELLGPNPETIPELWYATSGFTIRRLKKDVLPHLEDKVYIPYWVQMYPKQFEAYEQMRKNMVAWVDGKMAEAGASDQDALSPIISNAVVSQLIRLQQFASAYATVNEAGEVKLSEPSSKLDRAWDLMMERLDEDQPVVFYSAFKQLIALMRARLNAAGIPYSEVTGDIKQKDRDEQVQNFQSGKTNVFLGTTGAGGEGIELYRAQTVIFLSRDWRPSKNNQSEDRLHRSGQEGVVEVIDIFVEDTVEVDKRDKVALKWSYVKTLLGDDRDRS